MSRLPLLVFAMSTALAFPAWGQVVGADTSTAALGHVIVASNLQSGIVYVDGDAVGTVEDGRFELPPGQYTVGLVEPNREAWRSRQVSADVDVRSGEETEVRLDVPYRYRIESFPYGATVTLGDGENARVLGETPLDVDAPAPLEGDIVLTLPGHLSARQRAGDALDNPYSFVLRPLTAEHEGAAEIGWSERKRPNTWIDVAAVGLALSAGVVSTYYKFKGDDLYDEYLETGDPALRPRFERYDTYSAVALGAMQVGIGVFAVRLVLR